MGTDNLNLRLVDRCKQALAVGFLCGGVSVLVDIDHVICAALRHEPVIETGGCRLFHPYIIPASGLVLCLVIALGIGLLLSVVGNSAGTAT